MSSVWWVTAGAVLGVMLGAACSTEQVSSSGDDDCTSHYEHVAAASTWAGLQDAMLTSNTYGRVKSLRTQAQGEDVGAGNMNAVRVVDLLNRKGRRLAQVDVWRTEAGAWRAGVWSQCID
jgi:hypothetical protein